MLYIETWAVYEAYRRLGFKDEHTQMIVAPSVDPAGKMRDNVLHVVLEAQGHRFNYSLAPIDRPFEDARKLIFDLKTAIAEQKIPDSQLTEMYRSTEIGAIDGYQFQILSALLVTKGFLLPAIAN